VGGADTVTLLWREAKSEEEAAPAAAPRARLPAAADGDLLARWLAEMG
jgi:hypothetical protein